VSEQPEDPGRAESAGTKLSSFSSSLGPQRSAAADTGADAAGPSVESSPDGSDVGPGESQLASLKTQLADGVSDASSKLDTLWSERPEVVVGAAFVGGLVIATILKRLAR